MELTFASYNIHKAIGRDRRREPARILAVLGEIGADVVALQEADRRFGRRASVLPLAAIDEHTPYRVVPLAVRSESLGWHGNALLVRRGIELAEAAVVPLPTLEPRGAVRADLLIAGARVRVVGMHLDLSGLRRRHQLRAILAHLARCTPPAPTVLMGDCNEWTRAAVACARSRRQLPGAAAARSPRPDRDFAAVAGAGAGGSPLAAGGARLGPSAGAGAPGTAHFLGIVYLTKQ